MKISAISHTALAIAVVTGFVSPAGVCANELFKKAPSVFNYNFAELKFADTDGGDGIALAGSGDVRDNVALRFDYLDSDGGNSLRLGATYYRQSARYQRADLNFSAGIDRVEDEGGVFASVGVRYAYNDPIELNAYLELNTVVDTDLDLRLTGLYEFTPGLSALLETNLGDNSALVLGIRFYWR